MQQQPGPGKRGGCHGDLTQGHLLSFRFFSPLSPTFNDAAAACLGSVYFSVQHHDYHSRPSLAGTVCLCTSFMCRMFVVEN